MAMPPNMGRPGAGPSFLGGGASNANSLQSRLSGGAPSMPSQRPSIPPPTGANGIASAFQGVNPARAGYDVGNAAIMAQQKQSITPEQQEAKNAARMARAQAQMGVQPQNQTGQQGQMGPQNQVPAWLQDSVGQLGGMELSSGLAPGANAMASYQQAAQNAQLKSQADLANQQMVRQYSMNPEQLNAFNSLNQLKMQQQGQMGQLGQAQNNLNQSYQDYMQQAQVQPPQDPAARAAFCSSRFASRMPSPAFTSCGSFSRSFAICAG